MVVTSVVSSDQARTRFVTSSRTVSAEPIWMKVVAINDAVLPGGDFPWAALDDQVDRACERWGFLGERHARRLVEAYGTRIDTVLGDARSREQLGPIFGEDLTGVEVRHLMTREWARFPDDVLWRRSKLGLTMPGQDRQALAEFMANPAAT